MLAIGDVMGNINILKIGESLVKIEEQEKTDFEASMRREQQREKMLSKPRKKKDKKDNEEVLDEYDTYNLELEFYKQLDLHKE